MEKKLSEMNYGEEGVVIEIKKSRREINHMGIRVGKHLKMITKQPIKGPVVSAIREVEVAMGLEMADEIIVDVE